MPGDRHEHSNQHDYSRARVVSAGALIALMFAGMVAQSLTGSEVLDWSKFVIVGTLICALLGINRVRLGGL
jgi:hypothetical protein